MDAGRQMRLPHLVHHQLHRLVELRDGQHRTRRNLDVVDHLPPARQLDLVGPLVPGIKGQIVLFQFALLRLGLHHQLQLLDGLVHLLGPRGRCLTACARVKAFLVEVDDVVSHGRSVYARDVPRGTLGSIESPKLDTKWIY